MSGNQYSTTPGDLGHMKGWIYTDGSDPTITLASTINNDSAFAWTAFTVNVYMNHPFTLAPQGLPSSPNSDWYIGSYTAVASPIVSPYGSYIATIVYDDGTPIPNDTVSELDFSYQLSFSGSPSYAFAQEMIPVPEPSTLGLVAMGGLLLARFTLGRARRKG